MATQNALPTLPIDPDLPPGFDDTDNDQRSKDQLDAWWVKPYLVSNGDGSYTARCLNGGAWDRSTALATGTTIEEATALGLAKQAEWVRMRREPVPVYRDANTWNLAIKPQRPDRRWRTIKRGLSAEEIAPHLQPQQG